jgi:ADP-ribose pyrophosphatase YjhB (NUDIX family)
MAHIHELLDFVVEAFIVYDNKVLLIHHKKLDMWLPVGGHIELDEDPEEALFREVKEECGLEIEIIGEKLKMESVGTKFLYAPTFLDVHKFSETHRHIGLTYYAKAKSDKFIFNGEEHKDIKWFSEEELDNPELGLSPAIKFYAKEAFKIVKI